MTWMELFKRWREGGRRAGPHQLICQKRHGCSLYREDTFSEHEIPCRLQLTASDLIYAIRFWANYSQYSLDCRRVIVAAKQRQQGETIEDGEVAVVLRKQDEGVVHSWSLDGSQHVPMPDEEVTIVPASQIYISPRLYNSNIYQLRFVAPGLQRGTNFLCFQIGRERIIAMATVWPDIDEARLPEEITPLLLQVRQGMQKLKQTVQKLDSRSSGPPNQNLRTELAGLRFRLAPQGKGIRRNRGKWSHRHPLSCGGRNLL